MTVTEPTHDAPAVEMVDLTIDDQPISVPKGTLVIRAAELMGIQIPRFCDHPLLDPVGACRQCLVEVEGQRKPMASCTITCTPDMVVRTQHTSALAESSQQGVMELLLINHPLDCPVCDKGGECPLQNQAMTTGNADSRFNGVKRTFPKPIPISSQVLLDRERCVLCARCTRFSDQIAGDPFIELMERGALQQVGTYTKQPFDSYFSGNTVQICPVGALTGTSYRFRARPFDLVSSPSVCEHCAGGCAQRTDHRRGKVLRRLAGDDPEVNDEWNCDKGRWAFTYTGVGDRITTPLIRDDGGELRSTSWSHALEVAAAGLRKAYGRAGVLVGGRSTIEDAYAYSKFARTVLNTNDIDFRIRAHSQEESDFLATHVAGQPMTVTYSDLESAPVVLLVAFEPEDESPIVFLRLRKAARRRRTSVYSIGPYRTPALTKLSGTLLRTTPGEEPTVLNALRRGDMADLLRQPGAVIVVGERLATVTGGLSAATRLSDETGARLAWIPRRAGERGAVEAGALPNLLPGGRPSGRPGLDTAGILEAAAEGTLSALLVGGVEISDLPHPAMARRALSNTPFVVSLELRHSEVTATADVVFPVASVAEKSGTFLNWEGRERTFPAALQDCASMPDLRVLHAIAAEMGHGLGLPDETAARRELRRLGRWDGPRPDATTVHPIDQPSPVAGEAILAGWRMLLDRGRFQDGEPHLAGTARRPVARLSSSTATEIGVAEGDFLVVRTREGAVTLPLAIADLPDRVVWLPMNSTDPAVYDQLGVTTGAVVTIASVR
ncbi:NADH-quinone oxidoreductase subunit G [Mycolicibacterium sp. 120270]|uniref:NADH-quinone oxidoreductase subunit G n=1 Tax=Mycolicibacterium sp. 120270 TaxID=3090600 RepID=UPI00299D79AB|nr:NADH-quinone oxidoreductase subunit G [Mycolicibacterium sp. 120270]MDX1882144.1 NADH-quinone oxidoreductase subunit G [Mycolicibacterium sp. 120270]